MKVLLATHFYPPGHIGGTEDVTRGLAQTLLAAGHDVNVICVEEWDTAPSPGIRFSDEVYEGVAVRRLRFNWTKSRDVFGSLYNNVEVARQFSDYCRRIEPDVVHITSCYALSASIISAARELGLPVVLSATDFWMLCARNTLLKTDGSLCSGPTDAWECARCMAANTKVYRWPSALLPEAAVKSLILELGRHPILANQRGLRGMVGDWEKRLMFLAGARRNVDVIVTASSFLKSLFVKYGVPEELIRISNYGLDTRWAQGHESKTPAETLRIGFIGQIIPAKGPDLLIKALAHLGPNFPVQAVIYGDLTKTPKYGAALRDLAQGDARISFPGTFENSRMGVIMSGIDVLAVPSTWYDFPLVIPSALATRTPVIATNLPGMNELVEHGRNGLLFERHDWQALACQIQRLVQEPGLLASLRANIRPVKSWSEMTAEYIAIYESLLGRGSSRATAHLAHELGT